MVVAIYLGIGIVVGLFVQIRGLHRIDHAAKGAPLGFRILIFPAMVALWPVILGKWFRGGDACEYPDPEKPVGLLGQLEVQRWGVAFLMLIVAPLAIVAWVYRIGS